MKFVQYGCGPYSNAQEWINFDASPTLLIQKTPILGRLAKKYQNVIFNENIRYGDILKGLPNVEKNSCRGVYCSHVLEHLSLNDCRLAIRNTYDILQKGGIFRCIVPDLEVYISQYQKNIEAGNINANHIFLDSILLGKKERKKGIKGFLTEFFGNANHQYMWDKQSLMQEFKNIGFESIRLCSFNDSNEPLFSKVEEKHRFEHAVAIEAIK